MRIYAKSVAIALALSIAIIITISSLPHTLIPIAEDLIRTLRSYWWLAIYLIGLIHGLKPCEHSWPITIGYSLMQKSLKATIITVSIFTGMLTLVWTCLSALVGEVAGLIDFRLLEPYVDIIVGVTMLGVFTYLTLKDREKEVNIERHSYRVVWIHGLAAAFGGDFFVILILATTLAPITKSLTFLIGLLHGLGLWTAQMIIACLAWKGAFRGVRDWTIMFNAGKLVLGLLGSFLICLGFLDILSPLSSPILP